MKPEDNIKKLINESDVTTSSEADKRILADALENLDKLKQKKSAAAQAHVWRIITKSPFVKLAATAAAIVIVLGGIGFWLDGNNEQWWLGPQAAWGNEILASLDRVTALTYRQRGLKVRDDGPDTVGGLWEKRYAAKDKYRREVLDEANNITHIEWILPGDDGFVKYLVWPEHRCYTQEPEQTPPFYDNVMGWLQRWVKLLSKADRILGTQILEGRRCVGFEISPGMYEGFLVQVPVQVWFDVETKLPVRVERRGLTVDYDPAMKLTLIYDQFDYYTKVPADMFALQIPEGFANAHPHEIDAKKGQMVYADVPAKLTDEIIAALNEVETAVYEQHLEIAFDSGLTVYPADNIYMSRDCWRRDSDYLKDRPQKTDWYVIEKEDTKTRDADFNENNFKLIHTTVNFGDKTYSVVTYAGEGAPRHPLNRILFLAAHFGRADRMLENAKIEGVECVDMEISAAKYGGTPATTKDRVWFDVKTKLPVRMENVRTEDKYWQENVAKKVRVLNRFKWNPELPDDTFTPKIPEGFTLVDTNEP